MKVAVGADHRGFEIKNRVKEYLMGKGIEVVDFGTDTRERCDYPDYGIPVAEAVAKGEVDLGILFCGTGVGMSIVANKVKGIRAGVVWNEELAELARKHNDVNVLVIPTDYVEPEAVSKMVDKWMETEPLGDVYARRREKIHQYEGKWVSKDELEQALKLAKKWEKEARHWQAIAWRR